MEVTTLTGIRVILPEKLVVWVRKGPPVTVQLTNGLRLEVREKYEKILQEASGSDAKHRPVSKS